MTTEWTSIQEDYDAINTLLLTDEDKAEVFRRVIRARENAVLALKRAAEEEERVIHLLQDVEE